MKKSRRARRPMLRAGRSSHDTGALGATGRLASLAGGARPTVDQLEARQLLFSLTISPSDDFDGNGVGTVSQVFGYFAPVLYSLADPQEQEPTVTEENFDDEFPPAVGQAIPPVQNLPNNRLLLQSNIRVRHNVTPAANLQIVAGQPPDEVSDRFVRARLSAGQSITLRQEANATSGQVVGVQAMAFRIDRDGGTLGLNANTMAIQLFFRGQLIANFTGQALLNLGGGNANGTGNYVVNAPAGESAFDELRIVANGGPNDSFRLDDLSTTVSPGVFATVIQDRILGAELFFSGPVGATIQVFDLYGRDMAPTIALGAPAGITVPLFDLNDDGIPDGNDGIGRIVISGGDSTTSITMFGGAIRPFTPPADADDDFIEGAFAYRRIENLTGLYDELEGTKGFGYNAFLPPGQPDPVITGLPTGAGSVIIGSPWVRPLDDYRPLGLPADLDWTAGDLGNDDFVLVDNDGAVIAWTGNVWVQQNFIRPDQGIFVTSGSLASVYVHGILHGSSSFPGSLGRLAVSQLVGSVTVAGDLGALVVGGDAGLWSDDDNGPLIKTEAQLVVGRSVNEIAIGGRSLLDVTIVGDVNAPGTRPARDIANYSEKEFIYGIDPAAPNEPETVILRTLQNTDFATSDGTGLFRGGNQGLLFGNVFMRNDSVIGSEWVGSMSTGVRIKGELSARDPIQGEDDVDVYGFASDGRTPITIQVDTGASAAAFYFRIVDQDGRTLAAPQFVRGLGNETFLTYQPTQPGAYYLVLTDPNAAGDTGFGFLNYTVTILGIAPSMLGAVRIGASMGTTSGDDPTASINLLSGNAGSIRVGTGVNTGAGGQASPATVINTDQDEDDLFSWYQGTISVPGTLFNITTGSDISGTPGSPITITVGRDLGNLVTGLSGLVGVGPTEGDVNGMRLSIGGRVGLVDVRGAINLEQDDPNPLLTVGAPSTFQILTGRGGGNGDIGLIRVGSHAPGDGLMVQTPAGSIVGGILVSQDVAPGTDLEGLYFGNRGVMISTGVGSDVRFVDFPRIDANVSVEVLTPLFVGQFTEFTDDAGGLVRIRVIGTNTGVQAGFVRVLSIDGSQGVAIGQIVVDLSGGAALEIDTSGAANPNNVISIGKIIVTAATGQAGITAKGNTQIDVWKIESAAALAFIRNETPNGDFVAIDTVGLVSLEIQKGDLGRTEVVPWGPQLLGPFMGIGAGQAGGEGAQPLPIAGQGAGMNGGWTGQTYRPVGDARGDGSIAALDDIGSPFDPYLNGVVVRGGNVDTVRVSGAVGDVLVPAGNLVRVDANSDRTTATGRFDGLVGTLYAQNISRVDVGDGLAQRTHSPLSTTGIFAVNDIVQVLNQNSTVANISSTVLAANQAFDGLVQFDGVDTIDLTGGGDYRDAWIGSDWLDGFWTSFFVPDDAVYFGGLNLLRGNKADLFRSEISALFINTIELRDGFYDATFTRAGDDIGTVTAAGYRNSTLVGGDIEFRVSSIATTGNLGTLTTFQKAGDIVDLLVDVSGLVTGEISGRDMVRVEYEVDNTLTRLDIGGSLRSAIVNAGLLPSVKAAGSILSSRISSSGDITSLTAAGSILNSDIQMTGPAGKITKLTAGGSITGSITASGPIDEMTATGGDIRARIVTTTDRGNVTTLTAGRDLDIDTDISGSVNKLVAGRHIGNLANPRVIVIRSDLASATAGGQLYADLRIGQNLTDRVSVGAVSALPTRNLVGSGSIIAFGSINQVIVEGDFGGDIISYTGGIRSVAINNGSFYQNRRIAAYDGSIDSIVITAGNLYGNVHADYVLSSLQVIADGSGVFGDIGVNPYRTAAAPYDALRNQAPVGVAVTAGYDGSSITAGWYIVNVTLTNGSIFESRIVAGRALGTVDVRGGLGFNSTGSVIDIAGSIINDQLTDGFGSVIGAGDTIGVISAGLDISEAFIVGGLVDLGADGRAGGTGLNLDTLKAGRIDGVFIGGSAYDTYIDAGILAGSDGIYRTADDRVAAGTSYVNAVVTSGGVTNVWVLGDSIGLQIKADPRYGTVGESTQLEDSEVDDGYATGTAITAAGLAIDAGGGETFIAYFSGPGQALYDAAGRRIVLLNPTIDSAFTLIQTSGAQLTSFDIVTNDDASVGLLDIRTIMAGDSDIVVDANVGTLQTGAWIGTGSMKIGADVVTLVTGDFIGGNIRANYVSNLLISGDYGAANPLTRGEVKIDLIGGGSVAVLNNARGAVNVLRELFQFSVGQALDTGSVRAGGSITNFVAGSVTRSWVSVRDSLNAVTVNGSVFDSSIMAGADLGTDAEFGGVGLAADSVTSGFIGNVSITGDFYESDIAAGVIRGVDGFFGTSDDNLGNGRSSIGNVVITGTGVGSNRGSESYRIISTGSVGAVTLGGLPATNRGNFKVEARVLQAVPFGVSDLAVTQSSGVYIARIVFNQPVDSSSINAALGVYEVRGADGEVEIKLISGTDYTLTYDDTSNAAVITFARAVTERNLPQQAGVPGPGTYRFKLSQSLLKARLVDSKLDGDGDGRATSGDDYSADSFVGDVGDKITPGTVNVQDGSVVHRIDFYGPGDLNVVMDNNQSPDGLPDANTVFTVRGILGDHPDHNTNYFRFGGDTDIFRVNLQAGQILRLGKMTGAAQLTPLFLADENGQQISAFGVSAAAVTLPVSPTEVFDPLNVREQAYLIKQTGTYYIVVANTSAYTTTNAVANPPVSAGTIGEYSFSVEIFDDGDSGFNAPTDAGNGAVVVPAPLPSVFAGADQTLGTADDLARFQTGGYTFVYNHADGSVTGTNTAGTITSRRAADGTLTSSIDAAIGAAGHAGLPDQVASDVDIFHLNGQRPVAAGTRIRVTVKLTGLGADLGSRSQVGQIDRIDGLQLPQDLRGAVQFGVFDSTNAQGADDGLLLFSPSEFSPNGGETGILVDGENATYGYDENGDFFVIFTAPQRIGGGGGATLSVYLQGANNTDYQLEVVTLPEGVTGLEKRVQNFLIEAGGGTVDWLEVANQVTTLTGFDASILGFNGAAANGQTQQDYIISTVVSTLRTVFNNAGLAVNISSNPADFEREDFSTIYLTNASDPVSLLFTNFDFFGLGASAEITQPYGFSERTDIFNSDSTDEAVVFAPSFAVLGYTPSQTDVDLFVQSLSAAIGRRVGELLGLRITAGDFQGDGSDIMASNGVAATPGAGAGYALSRTDRSLSNAFDSISDTDFFLGRQNAGSLLDQVLEAR